METASRPRARRPAATACEEVPLTDLYSHIALVTVDGSEREAARVLLPPIRCGREGDDLRRPGPMKSPRPRGRRREAMSQGFPVEVGALAC